MGDSFPVEDGSIAIYILLLVLKELCNQFSKKTTGKVVCSYPFWSYIRNHGKSSLMGLIFLNGNGNTCFADSSRIWFILVETIFFYF